MIDRNRRAADRPNGVDGTSFNPMFPSPTAGDGALRPNNARPGKHQPDARPSQKRKVSCAQCGFLVDLSRYSNDGGNLDPTGAGGKITQVDGGDGLNAGNQEYNNGSGCPMCFSRNVSPGVRGSL